LIDEIQNLDEYTMFIPVDDITLSTSIVRLVKKIFTFSVGITQFSTNVRISLAIYEVVYVI